MTPHQARELAADELRRRLDPATLTFATTAEVTPLLRTIGQPRALDALDFGLSIQTPGFNLFVTGAPGSGRLSTVVDLLERTATERAAPSDWVYVHNFAQPDRPITMQLQPGRGAELAADMDRLLVHARHQLVQAFDSEEFRRKRATLDSEVEQQMDELRRELSATALRQGFALQFTPAGLGLIPAAEGRELTPDEMSKLTPEQREDLEHRAAALRHELDAELPRMRQLERAVVERAIALEKQTAAWAIAPLLDAIRAKYPDSDGVASYVNAIERDIPEHLAEFRPAPQMHDVSLDAGRQQPRQDADLRRYRVNLFVDNRGLDHAPVIIERNPTYYNLIGRIEYEAQFGAMVTDFMHVRAGSLHRANGGFLVIEADDLLHQPYAWDALKRTLRTNTVTIENLAEQVSPVPTSTLRPHPVPLDVKVC